jgi:hypothetical protein
LETSGLIFHVLPGTEEARTLPGGEVAVRKHRGLISAS